MIILRTLVRALWGIGGLLLMLVRKALKLTLIAAAAGAILMVLDTLLLEADNDRPGGA